MHVRRFLTIILALAVLVAAPSLAGAQGGGGSQTHTVQAGENLYRISLRYGTTVTAIAQANNILNPNLIYVGQVLIIPVPPVQGTTTPVGTSTPAGTPAKTNTPAPTAIPTTPTATPPGETVYIVQPGDNLFRIALRYGMATATLAAYNGIPNPNLIYVGQRIRIPAGLVPLTTATPTPPGTPRPVTVTPTTGAMQAPAGTPATPVPTTAPVGTPITTPVTTPAEAAALPPNEAANVGFAYGIEVMLPNQDTEAVLTAATDLGVTWVKQEIEWALYEPTQGSINWEALDQLVNSMDESGVNILLTVSSAPGWARDSAEENGPPADYQTFATFMGALAERYAGRVDAYEIWTEPNLRREWNTPRGLSAASYVELLRVAYTAIKMADPAAIVVTGGLAPTGYNDGVIAIDDRAYLRQMYAAGVADWSDAIGAHPLGWGNPPDSVCCRNNRPAVAAWDDHPSFFFKQTLEDYRQIMMENGDNNTYIWATQFGWGASEGFPVEPAADYAFVTYTSLDEQAQYILRAFQLGNELGYVGPMFLWNLNSCQVVGMTGEECFWSLLDPAGNPRPAYLALRDVEK